MTNCEEILSLDVLGIQKQDIAAPCQHSENRVLNVLYVAQKQRITWIDKSEVLRQMLSPASVGATVCHIGILFNITCAHNSRSFYRQTVLHINRHGDVRILEPALVSLMPLTADSR
jgi:hypothetical protein